MVQIDVVAVRRPDVKLPRTADLLRRICDHFLPLADPATAYTEIQNLQFWENIPWNDIITRPPTIKQLPPQNKTETQPASNQASKQPTLISVSLENSTLYSDDDDMAADRSR